MSPIISDRSERALGWRRRLFEKNKINWGEVRLQETCFVMAAYRFTEIAVVLAAKDVELQRK